MNLKKPIDPMIQSALIMIMSGIVASFVCAKVYGATLPLEEPGPVVAMAASQPAPTANDDAQAAAQLRAILRGQRQLLGTSSNDTPRR